ncbi:hypothetical protein CPLU01_12209 [Colletotrichum plurivorum]|uniref:Uncharacterized protein n=1 Tax=Colletotrichum plurivorum TaxID=2175906 RepID=A0A8H6JZW1_9PEZI|nr:hypothetical protein CPLU01_12209 [Colletotrichum plurivorum]
MGMPIAQTFHVIDNRRTEGSRGHGGEVISPQNAPAGRRFLDDGGEIPPPIARPPASRPSPPGGKNKIPSFSFLFQYPPLPNITSINLRSQAAATTAMGGECRCAAASGERCARRMISSAVPGWAA